MSDKPAQQGPYSVKSTSTIKIGAVEVTVEKTSESSHVPPAPCGCGDTSSMADSFVEGLSAAMPTVIEMLSKIARNTEAPDYSAPPTEDDPDKH